MSCARAALSVRLGDQRRVYGTEAFEQGLKGWIGVGLPAIRQSTFKENQKQMYPAGNLSAEEGICGQLCEFIFYSFKLSFPIYILRLQCCVNEHFSGFDLRNTNYVRCSWPARAKSEQSCSKDPV